MTETTVPIVTANVSRLTASLWIGGDLDTRRMATARAQLAELMAAGINTIIDCRAEWDDAGWVTEDNPQIDYLWIGVDDAGQRMPYDWFDEGTAYALEQIAGGHVVLSHCHMGINRGPSMGFAILLALGWDPIEALDLIRCSRPIAFVAYAEDALDWWLHTTGAAAPDRRRQRTRLAQWRHENAMDVARVIRRIRTEGVA